jgi:3-hydroxyacyl-CoA dehydrogenase
VLDVVRPTTMLEAAAEADIIFEAAPEDLALKLKLFAPTATDNPRRPWVFTNTSSIPIEEIDEKAKLGGRIMGFHFYNPPAVQKLVELIRSRTTTDEVAAFAETLCKNLRKVVVPSADRAGFIGNGHFMRDLLHAIGEVERIGAGMPFVEAVYTVNRVSQDFLVRPMGIFQLIDYVGLDVCQCILGVMNPRTEGEELHSAPRLPLTSGVQGGSIDGSQKDGSSSISRRPVGVYDPAEGAVPIAGIRRVRRADRTASGPALQWKVAVRDAAKDAKLATFFGRKSMQTRAPSWPRYGAARATLAEARGDGVALRNDVNQVL